MNTVDILCLEAIELSPKMQAVLAAKLLTMAAANNPIEIVEVVLEAYLDDNATNVMKTVFSDPTLVTCQLCEKTY